VAHDQSVRQMVLEREVDAALEDARAYCQANRLPDALAAVQRAEALLADQASIALLSGRFEQVRTDVKMAVRLDEIRLERSMVRGTHFENEGADRSYRDAFSSYGLDLAALAPDQAASAIRESAIKDHLLAALDDWAFAIAVIGLPGAARLLAISQEADSDRWRKQFRTALQRKDREKLKALARDPKVLRQPPATLIFLAGALYHVGEKSLAIEVVRSAQEQHPGDFWVNHHLAAELMRAQNPVQAVRFYQAALAIRPKSPAVYLQLGNALNARGDQRAAVVAYHRAIELQPDLSLAYHNLGTLLMEQGDVKGAVAAYRQAIAGNAELAESHINLGIILRKQGDLGGALKSYQRASTLKPKLALAYQGQGLVLWSKGDLKGATAAHEKAVAVNPNYADGHCALGDVRLDAGDLSGAERAYRQAIDCQPDLAVAHYGLGRILYRHGNLRGAALSFQQAIAHGPKLACAYYDLGVILQAQGNQAGALAAYLKAVALRPDMGPAQNNLGVLLVEKKDLIGAEKAFRAAIAYKHNLTEAYNNLGTVLYQKRDFVGASEAFQKAIARKPDNVDAHVNLGHVLHARRDLAGAMSAYEKALELRPGNATVHNNLGTVRWDNKDLDGAVRAYEKAIALKPDFAMAYYNLGLVQYTKYERRAALRTFQKAVSLKPQYAEAHYRIALILRDEGDLSVAVTAFQEAISAQPQYAEAHLDLGCVLARQGKFCAALEPLRRSWELSAQDPKRRGLAAQLLRHCERHIELERHLPDFLAGKKKPASADEQAALGLLCFIKCRHKAAAGFFDGAFAVQPKLASAYRYQAAGSAALAGTGQGDDAAQLDKPERQRLRSLALRWLREELSQRATQWSKNPPALRQKLLDCQHEPSFAGVREPNQLAKQPAAEQEAWRQFWAEVAKTLHDTNP
jgi:tetratricopeptide (TPR) repeat protein